MNYVDIVAMLAVIQYLTFAGLVGQVRGKYGVGAPARRGLGFILSIGPILALVLAGLVPALLGKAAA